jgi:hypothetical protein
MQNNQWTHGGYWFVRLDLDSVVWLKLSRPRTCEGVRMGGCAEAFVGVAGSLELFGCLQASNFRPLGVMIFFYLIICCDMVTLCCQLLY